MVRTGRGMPDYDSFISYSLSADGNLAPAVQAGLQRMAKPWSKRRALEVFRDETGLTVNPDLWGSITSALDDSSWFVLLASPESARSRWVDREVEHWLERGAEFRDRLLLVRTAGTIDWDVGLNTFSSTSDAIPPALLDVFDSEPLHVDLSWAHDDHQLDLNNPRFRQAIAHIAAPMHGVTPDDLIGDDVRQHRRNVSIRRIATVSLSVLTVLAVGASIAALVNAREANQNAAESRSRELAALAETAMVDDPELSVLLALEALYPASARTDEAVGAHRNTINQLLTVDSYQTGKRIETDAQVIAISPDGTTLAAAVPEGSLELWNLATGKRDGEPIPIGIEVSSDPPASVDMAFSPDGGSVLVWSATSVEVVDLGGRSTTRIPDASVAAAWRADGSIVYADGSKIRMMEHADASSQRVEVGSVEAEISALIPTVGGALVVGESVNGRGWVLPAGGLTLDPLPAPDGQNAVWVADALTDAVHRYALTLTDIPDVNSEPQAQEIRTVPEYAVVRLELTAAEATEHPEQHGSFPVADGTFVASGDGAFMAAIDGILEQGLPGGITSSPDRGHLVHVWFPGNGGAEISIPTTDARDLAWVPGERVLAVASRRGVEFIRVGLDPVLSDVWALEVSADGSRVITADGGESNSIIVWDSPFSEVIARYGGGPSGERDEDAGPKDEALSMRPDGEVAVFRRNYELEVVDLNTGERRSAALMPEAEDVSLSSPMFSPDGSQLRLNFARSAESGSEYGWMLVDAETGAVDDEMMSDGQSGEFLAWSSDGLSWYQFTLDPFSETVVLSEFTVETGQTREIVSMNDPPTEVDDGPGFAFAASGDGSTIALGFANGDVVIVDVEDGAIVWTLPLHPAAVTSLDLSADGERLLSVGRSVVMTEVKNGDQIWSSDRVPALANGQRWTLAEFSPGGRSIPIGGGYLPFHVLVDFDPALACASVSEDAFLRLTAITESESVCLSRAELRGSATEARPPAAADPPPVDRVPYDVPVGADPVSTELDAEREPVEAIDGRLFLPRVPALSFEATCPTYVDNDDLPLSEGQRGQTVAGVQTEFELLGYEIDVDGCFSPRMTSVVREFQTSAGLGVDGLVGPPTLQAIVVKIVSLGVER